MFLLKPKTKINQKGILSGDSLLAHLGCLLQRFQELKVQIDTQWNPPLLAAVCFYANAEIRAG